MPALLWVETGLCGATGLIALVVALTVLGRAPGRRLNQALSAVLVLQALWAGAAVVLRLLLSAETGNPGVWLELGSLFLSAAAILLPAFAIRYVDARTRTADLIVAFGLVALAVAAIPTLGGLLLADPRLISGGTIIYEVRPAGYLASLPVAAFITWAVVLFQRHQERKAAARLAAGSVLFLVGFAVGGVLRPFVPVPALSVAMACSVGIIAHAAETGELAGSVAHNEGVYFVPALLLVAAAATVVLLGKKKE